MWLGKEGKGGGPQLGTIILCSLVAALHARSLILHGHTLPRPCHWLQVRSLEARQRELEQSNKELTGHKFQLEAAGREAEAKLRSAEEECAGLREEVQRLRRENSTLDAGAHQQDKSLTQLRTRLAVLEQELRDKDQVRAHTHTYWLGGSGGAFLYGKTRGVVGGVVSGCGFKAHTQFTCA